MRFLTVADRELRAAARRKSTHWGRWLAAIIFFVFFIWLAWGFELFTNRAMGPVVFLAFSKGIFFFCLFTGAASTADALSREKREGTLGLLFLTNLNSVEILAGKLCLHGLAMLYVLLAIFPVMSLPFLVGGVPLEQFGRTLLALVSAGGFAMAIGFVASLLCTRQFPAVAMALGLALFFGGGLGGVAELARNWGGVTGFTQIVATFSPLTTLLAAENGGWRVGVDFWTSLAAVAGLTSILLLLVAWGLRHSWRDRPKKTRFWQRLRPAIKLRQRNTKSRVALRRRLLDINPFFWLAGRQRVSAPFFMVLTVFLAVLAAFVVGPYFGRTIGAGSISPLVGYMVAWLLAGLSIHAFVLYFAAAAASQQLAEDKQVGALELILCTPASERSLAHGLWLAYGRKMLFPALVAVLVHGYFIWLVANIMVLEPGGLPIRATPGELLWSALFSEPIRGYDVDWQFGFMLRGALMVLVVLMANWVMLGWVGRWLGLRMKHPGFAPMIAVSLAVIPPFLAISLGGYAANELRLTRLPERQFLPLMVWFFFGICLMNCVVLSLWAAGHLRRDFRSVVTGRFQSPTTRRWWQLDWRRLRRVAVTATALLLGMGLLVLAYFSYQSWRSQRAWTAFQIDLKQKGVSLDVAPLLPQPVPAAENFAQSAAYRNWLNASNPATAQMIPHLKAFDISAASANRPTTSGWEKQNFTSLTQHMLGLGIKFRPGSTHAELATALLQRLATQSNTLRGLAVATRLPYFQVTTNRDAAAVMHSDRESSTGLERAEVMFNVRACAALALGNAADAGEDVLTCLRLAWLARQSPASDTTLRVHVLLARSLQPLWEGLAEHRWNESQLAAFQQELARFDLLSDFTNAVNRVTLARIEVWQAIPGKKGRRVTVPVGGGGYMRQPAWDWQPRSVWFDNRIQLYQAGQNTIRRVDVAGGYMKPDMNWSDLNGLALDYETSALLQQNPWSGVNLWLVTYAQTIVNQAIIACALERQQLVSGQYPATLDPLVPQYLGSIPKDIMRGRPMLYQATTNASYVLWGVGQNGVDEGGRISSDDWRWTYATNNFAATPVRPTRRTVTPR